MTSQYATPDYQFFIKNAYTTAFVDEIAPQDIVSVKWTRTWRGGGSWSMTLPLNSRYTSAFTAHHQLIHIVRNGLSEFVGVIMKRGVDPLGKNWTIGGPDLTGFWLSQRVVGETISDARSGVGETVIKSYVNAYLGSTAAVARQGTTYLTGKTFAVTADSARGSSVYGNANRQDLLALTQSLCEAALLTQEVNLVSAGYSYDVGVIVDHTSDVIGAVPFSADWDNVEAMTFNEDYTQYRNHHYVAGDGSGSLRNVTEIAASGLTTDFRFESVIDVPWASSVNLRTTIGNAEVLKRARQLVGVTAKPFRFGQNSVYRTDFDVGWNISFAEAQLRAGSIDMPIAAVTVSVTSSGSQPVEDITFDLGQPNPDSVLRKYQETLDMIKNAAAVG